MPFVAVPTVRLVVLGQPQRAIASNLARSRSQAAPRAIRVDAAVERHLPCARAARERWEGLMLRYGVFALAFALPLLAALVAR
jgi:hypothetical protein